MSLASWIDDYSERDWRTVSEGKVRYALIGLGWWTTDVAIPAIDAATLSETTVLVSNSSSKAESVANRTGVERGISYDEFRDGAAADEYDAVYVATPNARHLEHVRTAAGLGKAILCEKPMEATTQRAEEMVRIADERDVPLMVAYRMHTRPAVRRARDLVESGFVGDPVQVYGNNTQNLLSMNPDPDQWRLDPDLTGYGMSVMDLGIYPLNAARFLLRRDPVSVQAHLSSKADAFDEVPDERASFRAVFEDEIHVVGTASQNAHEGSQLTITGTDGRVELRPAFHGRCALHLSRGDVQATVENESFTVEEEMREEFDYFSNRVLASESVLADGHHALVDMRTIEAIHRSSEEGGTVRLPPAE